MKNQKLLNVTTFFLSVISLFSMLSLQGFLKFSLWTIPAESASVLYSLASSFFGGTIVFALTSALPLRVKLSNQRKELRSQLHQYITTALKKLDEITIESNSPTNKEESCIGNPSSRTYGWRPTPKSHDIHRRLLAIHERNEQLQIWALRFTDSLYDDPLFHHLREMEKSDLFRSNLKYLNYDHGELTDEKVEIYASIEKYANLLKRIERDIS